MGVEPSGVVAKGAKAREKRVFYCGGRGPLIFINTNITNLKYKREFQYLQDVSYIPPHEIRRQG